MDTAPNQVQGGIMIAIIEPDHKVVWGIGSTPEQARAMAEKEIAEKPHFKVNKLEVAHLKPGADLTCAGDVLWQWVIQSTVTDTSTVQHTLF
jgi:hypothetical protein